MELLVLGIAQHQPVVGVPQHEGLRDVLDRIHQAEFGFLVQLVGQFLLADVEHDAHQVRVAFGLSRRQRHARPQPHIVAVLVAHAEFLVEGGDLPVEQLLHRFLELRVALMDAVRHFGEAQVVALHRHAQHVEHRARPEDDAAAHVPVPHAALAAVQRLVEARGGNAEDLVGLRRLGGLPVEGGTQQHQHQEGDDEQRRHLRDG